ncbi:MAG TPA: NAD(P)-dependent alcohol dehydrogenase [Bacteroidota bacterium]|nr:NAD(P)-dependent alcohol dehydrogenase [Bacteroidota bacterium]
MRAIVYTDYGPPGVLQLKEVAKPVPRDNEILIRVHATSVNYGDIIARNFRGMPLGRFNMPLIFWLFARMYFGFWKPRISILGSEFAGKIEAAGKEVKRFRKGDEVFGYLGQNMGAYAEYVCLPADACVATKPANMTSEEAAVVPYGATMALSLLRKRNILPGQKVLVNGASGGIGSAAVQLAKHFGAEVTGVCGTSRLEFVKSLGADRVIDYTKEDFTQNGETYDLIVDILGKGSFSRCNGSLKPKGIHLYVSFKTRQLFQMLWTRLSHRKRVVCAVGAGTSEGLATVKELVEAGKIKSIIDKRYALEQTAEAHGYVEKGQKKGSVVITVDHDNVA